MPDDKTVKRVRARDPRKRGRVIVRAVRLTVAEDEALEGIARRMKMTTSRLIRHQLQLVFQHGQKTQGRQ